MRCENMQSGSIAVAIVQRQVMVVQASRLHSRKDAWLDVYTFIPFGNRLFLPSACPQARISPSDVLAVLPAPMAQQGEVLELQPKAFAQFMEQSAKMQRKYEKLFSVWSSKMR